MDFDLFHFLMGEKNPWGFPGFHVVMGDPQELVGLAGHSHDFDVRLILRQRHVEGDECLNREKNT